jgi:hypothetical protein
VVRAAVPGRRWRLPRCPSLPLAGPVSRRERYTLENWEHWEEEKPEFFNDNFRGSVEDDMIPAASLRALNIGGNSRRRSSLGDVLGIGGEERRVAPVN